MSRGIRGVRSLVETERNPDKGDKADELITLLKAKVEKQRTDIDDRTDAINAIQRNFEQLSRLHAGDKSTLDQLKEKLHLANTEIADLKAQLKLNNVVRAEFDAIKTHLEEEIRRHQIVEMESVKRAQELFGQLYQAVTEKLCCDEENEFNTLEFQHSVSSLQLTERDLRRHLAEMDRALDNANKRSVELQSELSAKDIELNVLSTSCKQKIKDCDTTISSLNTQLTRLQMLLMDKEVTLGRIEQENGSLQKKIDTLEAKIQLLEQEYSGLMTELQVTKSHEAKQLQRATTEQNIKEDQIEQLTAQVSKLQQEMSAMQELYSHERQEHDQWRQSLIRDSDMRKISHQREIHALMAERDKLAQELVRATEAFAKSNCEKDQLQKTAEQALATQARERHQLLELGAEIELMKANLTHSDDVQHHLDVMTKSRDDLRCQLTKSESEQERLQQQLPLLERALNEATCQIVDRDNKLREQGMKLRQAKDELFELTQLHAQVTDHTQKDNQELLRQLELAKGLHTNHFEKIAELERQVTILQRDISTANERIAALQMELATARKCVDQLEKLQAEKDSRLEDGMRRLQVLQESFQKTIKKLVVAEEASESNLTCLSCLGMLKKPIICVPCGHTFCGECLDRKVDARSGRGYCKECEGFSVISTVPSPALDLLTGKFLYRKQVLTGLLNECAA
eukprot:TRINITY_DN1585_c0_g1_i2.p2 TRINITY_DN1585_c0_g1~~TRINITY_DN1585_c0_g1_i2.p2  ORF type:complete len:686 (+),score=124.47 TRINITY_DN1585_c0_g1_i2:718-2775(+)